MVSETATTRKDTFTVNGLISSQLDGISKRLPEPRIYCQWHGSQPGCCENITCMEAEERFMQGLENV